VTPVFTIIFILSVISLIVIVDVGLALNDRKGDTISEVMRAAGKKWMPLIMLWCTGWGILFGHWWF
jgi:hypothetical protein